MNLLKKLAVRSMAMSPYLWYLLVELVEGHCDFGGNLFGQFDVGVSMQEKGDHKILAVGQVDEVVVVVVVYCSDFRVCLGLGEGELLSEGCSGLG
jgi:hypothetical protein